jgi:parallel beta-helix repeat protein
MNSRYRFAMVLLISFLAFLLTPASPAVLLQPARADTWSQITLPAVISSAGNYKITGPWTGAGTALTITASDVVVDGQNFPLQPNALASKVLIIAPNATNILVENINETNIAIFWGLEFHNSNAVVGLYAENASNFIFQDSTLNNNFGPAIDASYSSNFTIKNCTANDNNVNSGLSQINHGLQADHAHNFTVDQSSFTNGLYYGISVYGSSNFDIQNSYISNVTYGPTGAEGVYANQANNFTIKNSTITNNGAHWDLETVNSANFSIQDCQSQKIHFDSSNAFDLIQSNISDILFEFSHAFAIRNSNINSAGMAAPINFTVLDSSFNGGSLSIANGNNFSVEGTTFAQAIEGLVITNSVNFSVNQSCFSNNHIGLDVSGSYNVTLNNDIFGSNGASSPKTGGAYITDSNCTLTNSTFDGNYDSLIWSAHSSSISTSTVLYENNFQQNNYTFYLDYEIPYGLTNQKLLFYNNLVNDSTYIDPNSYSKWVTPSLIPSILSLNITSQTGIRMYSKGDLIGGNFWAHPDGTGFSQTGIDADNDGFVDLPFDLFQGTFYGGTIKDYYPYSLNYFQSTVSPTPTPTASPSPNPSSTPTPTPTLSPTPTPSPTSSPTPTLHTSSPSPSIFPSQTSTSTSTATITSTNSPSNLPISQTKAPMTTFSIPEISILIVAPLLLILLLFSLAKSMHNRNING